MHERKYCWQRILLHWLSAVLILWVLLSDLCVALMDVERSTYERISVFNAAICVLYIPLFLLRCLLYRLCTQREVGPAGQPLKLMVCTVHEALYLSTAAVLLSGVLMIRREVDVLGWFIVPALLDDPLWLDIWFELHRVSRALLTVLLLVHVGAVVVQGYQGRNVLRRMLP